MYKETKGSVGGRSVVADVKLTGCSLELESELGQEKAHPTTEELCAKSGSDEEGTGYSDREDLLIG